MDKVTMDLTSMTPFGVGDDVRNHVWLIIAESSKLVSKLRSGLMSFTYHRELL